MPCVYALYSEESPEEYRYIGISKFNTPENRMKRHLASSRAGTKFPIYDWIRKHQDISYITLETDISWETAKLRERFYIDSFRDSGSRLLNLTRGGEGMLGFKHTDEAKAKMSIAKKGIKLSEERRKKISDGQIGRVVSEATRKKISDAQIGKPRKPNSPESNKKISIALTGKKRAPFSDSHRKHISEVMIGNVPWNKGLVGKQIAWNTGKTLKDYKNNE